MYECESWTIKKAEYQRIDAFELYCCRRLLRAPWTTRISNQSSLKEIVLNIYWKGWCLSWSSNILATWYKELTHWKRLCCWERLKAGGEGEDREWDGWMASQLNGYDFEQTPGNGEGQGSLACCSSWGYKELGTTEQLWWLNVYFFFCTEIFSR